MYHSNRLIEHEHLKNKTDTLKKRHGLYQQLIIFTHTYINAKCKRK